MVSDGHGVNDRPAAGRDSPRRVPPIEGAILAPLRLLERSRGWKRRGLILLYLTIITIVGGAAWWLTSLNGLPDVGEPFDVAAFHAAITVPADEDAFTLYRKAFVRMDADSARRDQVRLQISATAGWAHAAPEVQELVEAHRAALDLWLKASTRERAQPAPPGQFKLAGATSTWEWIQPTVQLNDLSLMGVLEATRRMEGGDLAGAWHHLRAALRASRHIGLGRTSIHRGIGQHLASIAFGHVRKWAEHPDLDPALLRQALRDIQAVNAMAPPPSDVFKADYLATMEALEDPEAWLDFERASATPSLRGPMYAVIAKQPRLFGVATFLKREPERSKRVYRILYAHWLSQADLPPGRRMPMVTQQVRGTHSYPDFPYAAPFKGLDAAHPLPADDLYDWFRSTLHADYLGPPMSYYLDSQDHDRRTLSGLVMDLAERLYELEHGAPPERSEQLIEAGYLGRLPEAYATEGLEP